MDTESISDAQLSALTLSPINVNEYTLDDNELDEHLPLDNGWHLHPRVNLGNLDRLPPEILSITLIQIDLQTLTDFRRVNQRAMEVIDSIPQYAAILEHTPDALRALLAVETANMTTCQDIYSQLCTFRCNTCSNFGDYLYLITLKRTCFECFTQNQSYLPLLPSEVRRRFGLTFAQLKSVPRMRSLPGCYSLEMKNCIRRVTLYDPKSAVGAGIDAHGSEEKMLNFVTKAQTELEANYQDRLIDWEKRGRMGRQPRQPRNWLGPEYLTRSERYMAVIRFPYLNAATRKSERRFQCWQCYMSKLRGDYSPYGRQTFNIETFKEHLKTCSIKPYQVMI